MLRLRDLHCPPVVQRLFPWIRTVKLCLQDSAWKRCSALRLMWDDWILHGSKRSDFR
jgi:hypothetical protein